MKFVPDFAKFLLDNGLVFQINRRVLHPLGLALVMDVEEDDNETVIIKGLWEDDDPEGIIFDPDTYEYGQQKWDKFLERGGNKRLEVRLEHLGFIEQSPVSTEATPAKIDFIVCENQGGWYTTSFDVPADIAHRDDREIVKWVKENHLSELDDLVHVGIYWEDPNVRRDA